MASLRRLFKPGGFGIRVAGHALRDFGEQRRKFGPSVRVSGDLRMERAEQVPPDSTTSTSFVLLSDGAIRAGTTYFNFCRRRRAGLVCSNLTANLRARAGQEGDTIDFAGLASRRAN